MASFAKSEAWPQGPGLPCANSTICSHEAAAPFWWSYVRFPGLHSPHLLVSLFMFNVCWVTWVINLCSKTIISSIPWPHPSLTTISAPNNPSKAQSNSSFIPDMVFPLFFLERGSYNQIHLGTFYNSNLWILSAGLTTTGQGPPPLNIPWRTSWGPESGKARDPENLDQTLHSQRESLELEQHCLLLAPY